MTLLSHMKQSGRSPPTRAAAWPGEGGDGMEQRCAKAARISYATTSIPARDDACSSWERRAMAEDAGSQLAAGTWPPRAYPCTFCRREFRSAQALGGHMNVHRHDRARLRHSSPPPPPPDFSQALAAPRARSLLQLHDNYSANFSAQCSNSLPIHISKSSSLPAATPYSSRTSGYLSDNAKSLPLRLQQLASEAAASLLQHPQQQRCTSSDLLSFLSPSIPNRKSFACHFSKERGIIKEKSMGFVSLPSSLPSPPSSNASSGAPLMSVKDAAARGRDNRTIEPGEDNTCADNDHNHPLGPIIKDTDTFKEALHAPGLQKTHPERGSDLTCMLWRKGAFGDRSGSDVDLELRLGRKPS